MQLNNAFLLFPGGTEEDKFKEKEVVQLLEWCLLVAWRAKFNLDGYIPSLGAKKKLINTCEAIKRNHLPGGMFGEPDDITAKTGECRWIAYEDCKSAARDDHYEIITDMYNSLVASEETVTN